MLPLTYPTCFAYIHCIYLENTFIEKKWNVKGNSKPSLQVESITLLFRMNISLNAYAKLQSMHAGSSTFFNEVVMCTNVACLLAFLSVLFREIIIHGL